MTHRLSESVPVVSSEEARAYETRLLRGDERREWLAISAAGLGVAKAVLADSGEVGGFGSSVRILVIVGKGHNGADAMVAARELLRLIPGAKSEVCFVFGQRALRPLAQRAWRELAQLDPERVVLRQPGDAMGRYDLCLDGLFGFQFRPPLDRDTASFLAHVNRQEIRLRAAVDLPSGLDDASAFRADFTYATALVKHPVLSLPNAGRVRLIDLGWPMEAEGTVAGPRVLRPDILSPLAQLRPAAVDKRSFGHLGLVGGSLQYPGAVLIAVRSALRSGVGLVTAFVPESLVPAFAAAAPEAMWVGWPETPKGGLSMEGAHLLRERAERITAWAIGPGLGREPETLAWVRDFVRSSTKPMVLDADALQPDIVREGIAARILTPHAGEWERISRGRSPESWMNGSNAVLIAKGSITSVYAGNEHYYSLHGGPVLARGGSGDLLAGLVGGLLAREPDDSLRAAARGVVWHGMAADLLARQHGQTAVSVTQLLDYLAPALRGAPERVD